MKKIVGLFAISSVALVGCNRMRNNVSDKFSFEYKSENGSTYSMNGRVDTKTGEVLQATFDVIDKNGVSQRYEHEAEVVRVWVEKGAEEWAVEIDVKKYTIDAEDYWVETEFTLTNDEVTKLGTLSVINEYEFLNPMGVEYSADQVTAALTPLTTHFELDSSVNTMDELLKKTVASQNSESGVWTLREGTSMYKNSEIYTEWKIDNSTWCNMEDRIRGSRMNMNDLINMFENGTGMVGEMMSELPDDFFTNFQGMMRSSAREWRERCRKNGWKWGN